MNIYEPAEDSFLLAQAVRKYAYGDVIDVGTGSGILALEAKKSERVTSVVATDINELAVIKAKKQGINAFNTSYFAPGDYDTIICNTPYLPSDKRAPDVALDGGVKGYEWTIKFLEQAKNHLRRNGQILFLISTLTNPNVVEQELVRNNYLYEIISRKKLFMEELLVYRAYFALPEHPSHTYLAKGKKSYVYTDYKTVIKLMDEVRAIREAYILRKVNNYGIGPKLIKQKNNYLELEYVKGELLHNLWPSLSLSEAVKYSKQVIKQLRILDDLGIEKEEMTRPTKHLILRGDNVVMIDFEKARHKQKTHNITQFKEYIKRVEKQNNNLKGLWNHLAKEFTIS